EPRLDGFRARNRLCRVEEMRERDVAGELRLLAGIRGRRVEIARRVRTIEGQGRRGVSGHTRACRDRRACGSRFAILVRLAKVLLVLRGFVLLPRLAVVLQAEHRIVAALRLRPDCAFWRLWRQ